MNEPNETFGKDEDDQLIAYLRNELSDQAHQQLEARLAEDRDLREELAILSAAADQFWDEAAAATTLKLSEQVRLKLGLAIEPEATVEPRKRTNRDGTHWFATLRRKFAEHAAVLQPALVALVVVQSGVIAHYMHEADEGASSVVVRGDAGSCADIWVAFKDGVSEQQIRRLLTLYDANIVAGPDESGRYRLGFADNTARMSMQQSTDAAQVVARFEAPVGCTSGAAPRDGGQP